MLKIDNFISSVLIKPIKVPSQQTQRPF